MKSIINDESDYMVKIGYYLNDKFVYHNTNDLPAFITSDAFVYWLKHGQYHRENGPARIHPEYINNKLCDYVQIYYLNGIEYTKKDYWNKINEIHHR